MVISELVHSVYFSLAPTAPPENIQATVTDTSLTISWSPPNFMQQNGVIRQYKLNLIEVETSTHYEEEIVGTRAVFFDKHPFYRYLFNISAVTVAAGPYSAESIIRLQEAGNIYYNIWYIFIYFQVIIQ